MARGTKIALAVVGGIALLVVIAIVAALAPSGNDDLAAAAPATTAERQIVERAFCTVQNGDPNHDVLGIEPDVGAEVEKAGIEHLRAGFIVQQWFSDLADHKISSACGKAIVAQQPG